MSIDFGEIFEKATKDHVKEIERDLNHMIESEEAVGAEKVISRAKELVSRYFGSSTWNYDMERDLKEEVEKINKK